MTLRAQVDDREAAEPKAHLAPLIGPAAGVVGTTMGKCRRHGVGRREPLRSTPRRSEQTRYPTHRTRDPRCPSSPTRTCDLVPQY